MRKFQVTRVSEYNNDTAYWTWKYCQAVYSCDQWSVAVFNDLHTRGKTKILLLSEQFSHASFFAIFLWMLLLLDVVH